MNNVGELGKHPHMTGRRQATVHGFAAAVLLLLLASVFLPVVGSVATLSLLPECRCEQLPLHAAVEVAGGLFALALATILLASRTPGTNQHYLWMAVALVGMGSLDIVHGAVVPGKTFVWIHSTATCLGGTLFALVWLPRRFADSPRCRLVLPFTIAAVLAISACSLGFPSIIPAMVEQGSFTTTAWGLNMLGGLGFLAAAGWFLNRYRIVRRWDDYLFACLCCLFGTAGVLFEFSSLWDATWWWWHLLRLAAYALAITYSAIGYQREIAERKRAEQQIQNYAAALESNNRALEELNEAVKVASRAKSEFLANMSHEIRTPMTAILGFADVLLEERGIEKAPPERATALETIKRNGEYLLELINDILDLSKIEAGKIEVECIACSPSNVVGDVASLLRLRAEAKGLALEIEYVGGIPETIQCDPTRLRQILINLVGNAIKFTEVGSVRLATRLVQDAGRPPSMQFDVIDTGVGMTQEQVSKIFQPFTQADASTTRKFGGTGLGLTISKRLAEMLGGGITISSRTDKGSIFSATVATGPLDDVPMLENVTESAPEYKWSTKAAPAPAGELNCRILLAEDGADNQRLISFVLKKAGAAVTVAENGLIAFEMALAAREAGEPFGIILMDMQMPIMDGYTATGRLRDAGYKGPIVALTAHAMAGDDEKCRQAGCDGYATKPIDRAKLLDTISQFLDQDAPVTETGSLIGC